MMPPRPFAAARILLPLLLSPLFLATCSKPKTVLFVGVEGTATGIVQLHVTLRVGAQGTEFMVPRMPGAEIVLPTSFTVEMDRGRHGAVDIALDAMNSAQMIIATGSASLADVVVGERNDITVTLGDQPPPPPDGGGDGGVDAGVDAEPDVPSEAGVDVPEETGADVEPDMGVEAGPDDAADAPETPAAADAGDDAEDAATE